MIVVVATAASAHAASENKEPDFQLALVRYSGGNWNPRPNGLRRLAWEIRKRTSIAVSLDIAAADVTRDTLFAHPFLVWQGEQGFPQLPAPATALLRQHLSTGGTLLVDLSDGVVGGAFDRSVRRELKRIFPDRPLARVPPEHVVYKSFYLADRHGGRVPSQAFMEGVFVEDRLAVILYANDLAGALAKDEFGQWDYDVGPGGEADREATVRLAVNIIMYALCLDYKEDQVHIPFILQRRR